MIIDPWIYGNQPPVLLSDGPLTLVGSDGIEDDSRLYQCFMYMRDPMNSSHVDSNHYALPLAISPVVSTTDLKVVRIDIMPTGEDHTIKPTTSYKIQPPNEYTPEHQKLRTDLKPLNVVQPEGASFKFKKLGETGEALEWQKWSFKVGFNAREGVVLYDVSIVVIVYW